MQQICVYLEAAQMEENTHTRNMTVSKINEGISLAFSYFA